jgi:hypothetical protein
MTATPPPFFGRHPALRRTIALVLAATVTSGCAT